MDRAVTRNADRVGSATSQVEVAIMQAVAYADVFDYPLTAGQLHRYLVGVESSPAAVLESLGSANQLSECLDRCGDYYFLVGREEIVETRLRRAAISARAWPMARRYGHFISRLPHVRMVAVSGALTMNNMEANTDTDFFIVTEPGHLWLARAMVVALVQVAARRGQIICPNYFLSERNLTLDRRTLFTAHELAQMVPIFGQDTYRRMCRQNSWAIRFLPNAFGPGPGEAIHEPSFHSRTTRRFRDMARWPKALAEVALRTPPGASLEGWEMRRKVRKLTLQLAAGGGDAAHTNGAAGAEVAFSADRCKGHFDRHGQTTLEAFIERLDALSIRTPLAIKSLEELERPVERMAEEWP